MLAANGLNRKLFQKPMLYANIHFQIATVTI